MAIATFAAGCFWGVESRFRQLEGVLDTCVGYTGGHTDNPDYKSVCSGNTGHAEAIEVRYDPAILPFDELLHFFWQIHDPTTLDRQGPDVGSQYRSAIFYHDEEQQRVAENLKSELNQNKFAAHPIVTEINRAGKFYPAEDYHQRYIEKQRGF